MNVYVDNKNKSNFAEFLQIIVNVMSKDNLTKLCMFQTVVTVIRNRKLHHVN